MKHLLVPFIALTLFVAVQAACKDCGSKVGSFSNIEVTDCDLDKPPCALKRNTTVSISIEFIPTKPCTSVTAVVHGILMGMKVPFPISNPHACQDSGINCPLETGAKYKYTASLPVLKSYPKVKVDVMWELKNEADENIVCVLIPAKIE